jgi:hypothetical protein
VHLVQILLPLYDNEGVQFGEEPFARVRRELTGRFGGLTTFSRAPAEGLWKEAGKTHRDDIVVFEVMTATLDRDWWSKYRRELETLFRQDEIVVRAQDVTVL